MPSDVSDPSYWNDIYRSGDAGWDKGRVSPPIARMIAEGVVAAGSRVVVLGAGRGHDALHIAQAGFRVTAVDFAAKAAEAMRAKAGERGVALEVLQEDVFVLPKLRPGAFDAALEHTCFCAIDPARRREYVDAVHAMLVPGGLFFGLFYAHERPDGPPYTTNEAEVRALFALRFATERMTVAPDSFPERAGKEIEFVFRRL